MVVTQQVHRYPRRLTALTELFAGLAVLIAALGCAHDLILYCWSRFGIETSLFGVVPGLREAVLFIRDVPFGNQVTALSGLLPSLGLLLLTLLLAILLRNSLPTVRTSARGMLVEFAGDWLPVPWESLQAIKVTEDVQARRFVLLAETERSLLTGWHRFYSLIYRLGFRRGFLITSTIGDFEGLVKTLLSETDRVARVLDNAKPATLDEDASSPLFRFLLSPASFFSQKTRNIVPVDAGTAKSSSVAISGAYPSRITALFGWGALLLAVLAAIRYVVYWLQFLALTFPDPLLRVAPFSMLPLTQAQQAAPWWLLIAAHIMAAVALLIVLTLRNLLPPLEARREGLAVRYGSRWQLVPWSQIVTIKETELSEEASIALIQTKAPLPISSRMSSLLYDGGLRPGILVTSALSHFDTIMERIVLEVTRQQSESQAPVSTPIVQSDAPSPLLLLTLRAGITIDRLVETIRQDNSTLSATARQLLRAAGPMLVLSLPPALLGLFDRAVYQGLVPDTRLLISMAVMFALSFLEWPLICLGALSLDEVFGKGEEGYRPFYLYPVVQLPRILPLIGALAAMLVGIPFLPILFWIGAIFWSFLLAAGLWESLYGWRGRQLLIGGLAPVLFQVVVLLAYLLVFR